MGKSSGEKKFGGFETPEAKELFDHLKEAYDDKSEFFVLSTIRYDPPPGAAVDLLRTEAIPESSFFLLQSHWERLNYEVDFFGWDVTVPYDHLLSELRETIKHVDRTKSYKLRVLVSAQQEMKIEASEVDHREDLFSGIRGDLAVPPPKNEFYRVFVDTEFIAVGPFTSFKTTKRDHYSAARNRSLRPEKQALDGRPQEVLLYNSRNEITEGTITNVAFLRNGLWITPPLTTGCLCGVVRDHLLSTGTIQEGVIMKESVQPGDPVLVFNGIIGVCRGEIY
ncbi:hypothetical protein TRVA0_039S00342 [Trichomonascus vanleenenianus]|uniref:aminodeoxychorismate lyase ABZ2 n=1 Tax=Trichomonascus vanleenenianus TaxID=2268995 RepID=UPI003ECAD176